MSGLRMLSLLLSVFAIFYSGVLSQDINRMILEDGEFKNVLIAIKEDVPEDPDIINNIKDMFNTSSPLLFSATKFRAFWKEIRILVPKSWTRQPSYGTSRSESFNRANIRIISGSESTEPDVLNHEMCGKEGHHMTMTSGYLHSTNKCHDMDIVRYWARLRWSLLPEHFTGDDHTSQFYEDSDKGRQLTRCSLQITENFVYPDTSTCRLNPWGEIPDECIFQPECKGVDCASLMVGSHCVPTIAEFCNSDRTDKNHYHNYEAPNLQNVKCGKSAWDVLYDSADFGNGKNPPMSSSTHPDPSFTIVMPPDVRRVVLVLDVSGSMDRENHLEKVIQGATIFLLDLIPAGSEVGIVVFSNSARRTASLRQVRDDDSSRRDLVNLLPSSATGSTCIGCGIREAINTLGGNSNGSYIFLLSDGEENVRPLISEIHEVNDSGVVIDTIAIAPAADKQMEDLAGWTGGIPELCQDTRSSACVTAALMATIVERPYLNQAKAHSVVKIKDVKVSLRPDGGFEKVFIGDDEGNDTVVAVTWLDFNDMDVTLKHVEGPNHEVIDKFDPRCHVDNSTRITTFRIPVASPGNWEIDMQHNERYTQTVGLTVTTKPRSNDIDAVDVHVFLSSRNVDFTTDPKLGVFALVQRGSDVVKNADVQAVVENSVGSITTTIPLHDDGTGSDFIKDDGIYSGHFLNFDANGRYSVMVDVLGNTTSQTARTIRKRRAVAPTLSSAPSSFMRSASGGVFVVDNYIPNAPDILPPSRIQDLAYSSFSYEDAAVTLTWTAVGDDLDQGTASEYELRFSTDFEKLRVNFTHNTLMVDHQIIDGNLSLISPGGDLETLTILLPIIYDDHNYYFSIRALDDAGNAGAMSNIVSLSLIAASAVNISTSAPNVTDTLSPFTILPDDNSTTEIARTTLLANTVNATGCTPPSNTQALNATSPATSSLSWTTDMDTLTTNASTNTTDRMGTTLGTNATDQSRTGVYSPVSGTVQMDTQEPMTSGVGSTGLPIYSSSTSFEDPLNSSSSLPDVSSSTGPPSIISTSDHIATDPVNTEVTLMTSTGGSEDPNPTEPQVVGTVQFDTQEPLMTSQRGGSRLPTRSISPTSKDPLTSNTSNPAATGPLINTESTWMTSTGEGEQRQTTEPQESSQEPGHTTEEPDEPTDLALIISISVAFIVVVFAGVVGGAFGVAMYKKKLARIRPATYSAESYPMGDDQSGEFPNHTNPTYFEA